MEGRLAKFGIAGPLPEEALKELGSTLVDQKKYGKAVEAFQYRAQNYPRSVDAQVGLGDA